MTDPMVLPWHAQIGDALPPLEIDVTITSIVAASIATRDFHPVHHDGEVARRLGHPGLFINIMTTAGYVERFIRAWAGPGGRLVSSKLKLGVPHYAGETLNLAGSIAATGRDGTDRWVDIAFSGTNRQGRHAGGQSRILWTERERALRGS